MAETQVGSADTQNASGSPELELKTQYEQDKHDGVAYESYKKAVNQYKKSNEEVATLKAQLQSLQQDKMQAEGNKDELIASLRKQVSDLDEKSRKSQASYTWNVVGAQIKGELAARGVRNPDKALEYAKAVHREDLSTVEVDEEYRVNKDDMRRFVDKFLNDNQDMGFLSTPGVKDMVPGKVELTGEENKSLSKASDEDIMKAWKAAEGIS